MKRILLVVATLLLGGCMPPAVREFIAWSEVEKPKATRGEIKWSEYYKEAYSRIEKAPNIPDKADAMDWFNTMIQTAQLYEGGAMTKDQFENIQRTMQVEAQRKGAAQNDAARRAMGQALQNYGNTVYGPDATRARQIPTTPAPVYQPPRQTNCTTYGNQTNCTTQ